MPRIVQSWERQKREVPKAGAGSTYPSTHGVEKRILLGRYHPPPECMLLVYLQIPGLCMHGSHSLILTFHLPPPGQPFKSQTRCLLSSGSCPSLPRRLYAPPQGSQSTSHLPYHSLPHYVIMIALVPCPSHPLQYKPLRAGSVLLSLILCFNCTTWHITDSQEMLNGQKGREGERY